MLTLSELESSTLQFNHALPYGAVLQKDGVRFVTFSRNATAMRLLLYKDVNDREPSQIIEFDQEDNRWGDIWSLYVPGVNHGQLYHLQADGPFEPSRGMRFDGKARLIDPFAKALAGEFQSSADGILRPPKCVVVDDYFDWEGDRHLKRDLSESIIYEMHVRGFTKHESSDTEHPGTYLGVIDKIPYLQSLGVTAVELMPVHEFPIRDILGQVKETPNYWGYDSLAFFSPHRGYAFDQTPAAQVNEFKLMVKELHKAGIEVILDVVFNHTCEGNERGPTLSFKGLENSVYYMLENDPQYYRNYSGCGNTVNGNHPVVREMIFHCLRYWVHNYHIDGFRFDLASILSRDRTGNLVPNPPLVEAIGEDPLLADTKIIAEAWDAAGAYQVGSFGDDERWAEWNGRYRDDVRRFWRGDGGMRGAMATRLAGSADLYQAGGRPPYCSINFITSHDGFSLNDLVSYRDKHNLANGEDNRDGDNNNYSDNFGVEGPTDQKQIDFARQNQIKNMLTTLMLSQGVPMLVAGDEFRRTQNGNNNAYCQDNEISWLDWNLVTKHKDMHRFCKALIEFRKTQPAVRRLNYLTGQIGKSGIPDVSWFTPTGKPVDWQNSALPLVCILSAPKLPETEQGHDILLMFNSAGAGCKFQLPETVRELQWTKFVDTSSQAPDDIYPDLNGPKLPATGVFTLPSKSMAVFVSK